MRVLWMRLAAVVIVASFVAACLPTPAQPIAAPAAVQPPPEAKPAAVPPTTAQPPAAAPTGAPDPLALVKAFEDAFNRHDVDGLMATLAADACSAFGQATSGCGQRTRSVYEWFFGANAEFHTSACAVTNAGHITCQLAGTDDCVKAAGVAEQHWAPVIFSIVDGKITNVTTRPADEQNTALNDFFKAADAWAMANRLEDWNKLEQGGEWPRNRETGALSVKLCKEYAAAKAGAAAPDPQALVKAFEGG